MELLSWRADYLSADTRESLEKLTNFRDTARSTVRINEGPVGGVRRFIGVPCTFEAGKLGNFEVEVRPSCSICGLSDATGAWKRRDQAGACADQPTSEYQRCLAWA